MCPKGIFLSIIDTGVGVGIKLTSMGKRKTAMNLNNLCSNNYTRKCE